LSNVERSNDSTEIILHASDGKRIHSQALTGAGRDMVRVSLSLAAAECHELLGLRLPLLLDDPFRNLGPREAIRLIVVLNEVARGGAQLVVFTENEAAVHSCRTRSVTTRELTARSRESRSQLSGPRDSVVEEKKLSTSTFNVVPNHSIRLFDEEVTEYLSEVGVHEPGALLDSDPATLADLLKHHDISAEDVSRWQSRVAMAHFVSGVTATDAEILARCNVTDPGRLSDADPDELHDAIHRYLSST
jgi:hypothetical protein